MRTYPWSRLNLSSPYLCGCDGRCLRDTASGTRAIDSGEVYVLYNRRLLQLIHKSQLSRTSCWSATLLLSFMALTPWLPPKGFKQWCLVRQGWDENHQWNVVYSDGKYLAGWEWPKLGPARLGWTPAQFILHLLDWRVKFWFHSRSEVEPNCAAWTGFSRNTTIARCTCHRTAKFLRLSLEETILMYPNLRA